VDVILMADGIKCDRSYFDRPLDQTIYC